MYELLRTKLFIPRPRSNLVSRPRLTERLNAGPDRKLSLIAAPAGFGKTTALSEWIPQSPRCVTWLSLDRGDNDPILFWAYFITSVQQIHPELGAAALSLLRSPQSPPIPSILTSLLNDIAAFPDPFYTVLDDYHAIEVQLIHEGLAFLIDHLPGNFHLVITTRVDPPLPLARLRARNQLDEMRANDLRFSVDETAVFLRQVMGLSLAADEIDALELRTEGWIAGLQIAALSMKNQGDVSGFVRAFSGSHRHILGYLAEEVLEQRPEGTMQFLLQTSILDRLCGPLCDAVTGETGGQAMLEKLDHANFFLSPLDDESNWFRYHQLFAEVLQARLMRTWPDRLPMLHRRAGKWYESQGMNGDALNHFLAADDFAEAARLVEIVAGSMLRRGASATLIKWLDAIPEETVRTHPRLSLVRGWSHFMGPVLSLEGAEGWAQRALQIATANGSLDSSIRGEVAGLRAMIAATRGEVGLSLKLSHEALEELPADNPWRNAIVFCLGTAHYLSSNMAAAAPVFADSLRVSQDEGEDYIKLASASFLAEIQISQGRLRSARELCKQVLDWANPVLPQKGGVMAHGGLAFILCEQDQLDAALAHIQRGAAQLDQVGGAWSAYLIFRVLARVRQAKQDWVGASEALDRAYTIGQSAGMDLVMEQAAALRANLDLAHGDIQAATAWAASSGLSPDDPEFTHPGWREVAYLSLARILAAQGRQEEALLLLDRLMDSAQDEGRAGSAIAIFVLQAMINQAGGNKKSAFKCLECALSLAEPEGYIRVFLDEGDPMQVLLAEFQVRFRKEIGSTGDGASLRIQSYTNKLLLAYSPPVSKDMPADREIIDSLTERELEVLLLISRGLSNQEIADILVVAISTVKSHINSLYGKLGAHRRAQAISLARERGLLAD